MLFRSGNCSCLCGCCISSFAAEVSTREKMASSSSSSYGGRVALLLVGVLALLSVSEGSNLMNVLKNEQQFSIFYKALVESEELTSLEGRTVLNGSAYVVFAPTDASFNLDFEPPMLACLQRTAAQKGIIVQLLRYWQVTTLHTPVQSLKDLTNAAVDGRIWTVLGTPLLVSQLASAGSVELSSQNETNSATVTEVRVVDPNVTLIPLSLGVVMDDAVADAIMLACWKEGPMSAAVPSSGGVTAPESGSSKGPASASSASSPAPKSAAVPSQPKLNSSRRMLG